MKPDMVQEPKPLVSIYMIFELHETTAREVSIYFFVWFHKTTQGPAARRQNAFHETTYGTGAETLGSNLFDFRVS